MSSTEKKILLSSFFLLSISGFSIAILKNFFTVEDAWGISAHPYLSEVKFIHQCLNMIFIFSLGLIAKNHIYVGLTKIRRHRKSGLMIFFGLVFLIPTGQSLMILSSQTSRALLSDIHFYLGVFTTLVMLIHLRLVRN